MIIVNCLTFERNIFDSHLWGGAKDQLEGWRETRVLQQSWEEVTAPAMQLLVLNTWNGKAWVNYKARAIALLDVTQIGLQFNINHWNESTTEKSHRFSTQIEEQEVWGN